MLLRLMDRGKPEIKSANIPNLRSEVHLPAGELPYFTNVALHRCVMLVEITYSFPTLTAVQDNTKY